MDKAQQVFQARLVPWLYVSELARSLSFYTETLGFTLRGSRPEEKSAYLDYHGARMMLQEPMDGALILQDPAQAYDGGMHLLVETQSVDQLCTRIKTSKSADAILVAPRNRWYRLGEDMEGHREMVVRDPDGYLIRFYQPLEGLEDA